MRPFFNQNTRTIQILNYLEQHPVSSFTELAQSLALDRATLSKDVAQLTTMLTQQAPAVQLTVTHQGLHYHRAANFNLATLMPMLIDQRLAIIFERVFNQRDATLTALAAKLYVSPSTARRLLTIVNHTLADYHVTIPPRTLRLTGPEPLVRYTTFQYFWNTYGSVTWPFAISQTACRQVAQQAGIPQPDQLKFAFWVAIHQHRRNQRHFLTATELHANTSDPEATYQQVIQGLDFTSLAALPEFVSRTALPLPVWQPANTQATASSQTLLSLAHWAATIWHDVPLLYDRADQLAHYQQVIPAKRFTHLTQTAAGNPLLLLKLCESLVATQPAATQTPLTLALVTDSDALGRQLVLHQLKHRFAAYHFTVTTDLTQADLILTNLTLPQAATPIVYVNVPLSETDFTLMTQQLTTLKSK